MHVDVVAFFSRMEELRAQKPAISKPGRGAAVASRLEAAPRPERRLKAFPGAHLQIRFAALDLTFPIWLWN